MIYEYYSDEKRGMLRAGMSIKETRDIIKSSFLFFPKGKYEGENDYFICIGLITYYDEKHKLYEIKIVDECSKFYYRNINFFTEYLKLKEVFDSKEIKYRKDDIGLELENEGVGIYIPDIIDDPNDPDYEKPIVKAINIFLDKGCSVSFERLISNHIPSKVSYVGSKIDIMDGPAIRMEYEDQKYFASHGKSKAAKQYREEHAKLISQGKFMEAIKQDIADIKSKSGPKYAEALHEMKRYAESLNPKDFIKK